jgi:hypothetical protein
VELRGFEPLTPSMRTLGQAVDGGRLRRSVAIPSRPRSMLDGPVAGRTAGPCARPYGAIPEESSAVTLPSLTHLRRRPHPSFAQVDQHAEQRPRRVLWTPEVMSCVTAAQSGPTGRNTADPVVHSRMRSSCWPAASQRSVHSEPSVHDAVNGYARTARGLLPVGDVHGTFCEAPVASSTAAYVVSTAASPAASTVSWPGVAGGDRASTYG